MDDYNLYPEKPNLETKTAKGGLGLTVFSMALFVLGMLLLFPNLFSFIMILLTVVLIHELGHFILMKIFNYEDVKMLFIPLMGAFVSGHKERYSQKQSLLVVLAGPIPGIVFGIVCFYYAQSTHIEWVMTTSFLFLFLNLMNLLPLDPLDGGQLLRILVRKNRDFFQFIFSLASSFMMIGLGFFLDSYLLIGFGFLMAFRVRKYQKNYQIRQDLKEEEVPFELTYKELNNKQYAQIKRTVLRHTPTLEKYISLNTEEDIEPIVAQQVKNILSPPMLYDVSVSMRIFVLLLWLAAIILPVIFLINNNIDWYGNSLENWR